MSISLPTNTTKTGNLNYTDYGEQYEWQSLKATEAKLRLTGKKEEGKLVCNLL